MAKALTDISYQKRPYNNHLDSIPGENGLPLVGLTLEIIRNPYKMVDRLYRTYGSVARGRVLSQQFILLTGPDINQKILLDTEKNFSPMMGYDVSLSEFYGGGLLMRDFDDHKMHRRMFQTAFKNDTMRHYTDLINDIVKDHICQWQFDRNFHFFPNIKQTLLDIAAHIFLGLDNFNGQEAQRIAGTFEDITEGMMGIIQIDHPLFFLCKWRKGKQARRYMENYLIEQIPQRRAGNKMDIFSVICRETDENGEYFSNEDIAAHINFLLFAAHDTTTSNLSYIMQYLGQAPGLQERARAECQHKGKEALEFDDLKDMQTLHNIHHEALRLHPSVMMLVRRTIRECVIDGVNIPADAIVNVYPQYTNMMEEHWTNPTKFDPDRFSVERAEHKRHPFQFVPFGGGAHKCIGLHFAEMIVKCVSNQMLLQYKWTVPEGYTPQHQVFPMPKQKDNLPLILYKI